MYSFSKILSPPTPPHSAAGDNEPGGGALEILLAKRFYTCEPCSLVVGSYLPSYTLCPFLVFGTGLLIPEG